MHMENVCNHLLFNDLQLRKSFNRTILNRFLATENKNCKSSNSERGNNFKYDLFASAISLKVN